MAMIYELTRQFKIELCRPVGACIAGDSLLRRVSPYANLCRPFGACIVGDSLLRRVPYANLCQRMVSVFVRNKRLNHLRITQESPKNHLRITQESPKNHPRITQDSLLIGGSPKVQRHGGIFIPSLMTAKRVRHAILRHPPYRQSLPEQAHTDSCTTDIRIIQQKEVHGKGPRGIF